MPCFLAGLAYRGRTNRVYHSVRQNKVYYTALGL